MNAEVIVYRIVSILLLPVAILFGLSALVGLLSVVANPSAIIGVLLMGSVVYYIISSSVFLSRGITNDKPCKPSLRKNIQINGIVAAVFCVMILCAHFILINHPEILKPLAEQMMKQPGLPANMTQDLIMQSMQTAFTFFMVISLVLLLHIIMSFRLLKQFDHLFR